MQSFLDGQIILLYAKLMQFANHKDLLEEHLLCPHDQSLAFDCLFAQLAK
jgi:hypothetical protein